MRGVYFSNYLIVVSSSILFLKVSFGLIATDRLDGVMYSIAYAESENMEEMKKDEVAERLREDKKNPGRKENIAGLFSDLSAGEAELLSALKRRAQELDGLQKNLSDKENLLLSVEDNFEKKLQRMAALKDDLLQIIRTYKNIRDRKVGALVKIYENMKAQEAARIFENLDSDTLLEVINQMNESKLAGILSKMSTVKAKEVTVMLANLYKFKAESDDNDCVCIS